MVGEMYKIRVKMSGKEPKDFNSVGFSDVSFAKWCAAQIVRRHIPVRSPLFKNVQNGLDYVALVRNGVEVFVMDSRQRWV